MSKSRMRKSWWIVVIHGYKRFVEGRTPGNAVRLAYRALVGEGIKMKPLITDIESGGWIDVQFTAADKPY